MLDNAGPGAMPGPAGFRLALHKSGHYAHAKQPALPLRQPGFLVFGREHCGLQALSGGKVVNFQDLALFGPFPRELGGASERFGSERGWLGALTDTPHDLWCKKGQRDQALHVTIVQAFSLGDLSDGSCSARGQFVEPAVSPRDDLKQRRIGSCWRRVLSFDHEPQFHSSPLHLQRYEARHRQGRGVSAIGLTGEQCPQIQRHSDSAALRLNSIDQIAEVVGEFRAVRELWAKESSTLSVSRPIEVVVLNC
jgi:hypothetical protein